MPYIGNAQLYCTFRSQQSSTHELMCVGVLIQAAASMQMQHFLRANQWEPLRLDSGEAATKQIGAQYEYGAKLDPSTGTPEEIEYLHLLVTAVPIAIGKFD